MAAGTDRNSSAGPTIERWLAFTAKSPHECSIQYPPRPEYFMENYAIEPETVDRPCTPGSELLYVHVPFCEGKCAYCFFATDARTDAALQKRYVDAVLREIETCPWLNLDAIRCLDVGGGTPTALRC